jgi:hypothetical protein
MIATPARAWRRIVRTAILWSAGLIAGMIIGGLIGNTLQSDFSRDGGFFGAIAGAAVFICARLWATERSRDR